MMSKISIWFKKLFGNSSDTGMKNMLGMLTRTQEQELACDEVHALIDQFAEMKIRGEDPSDMMPLVQQHLDMCPDCRDEYDALMLALQVD